jgi:hypothetical protein
MCVTSFVDDLNFFAPLVPGVAGSQLQGRLSENSTPGYYCLSKSEWCVFYHLTRAPLSD